MTESLNRARRVRAALCRLMLGLFVLGVMPAPPGHAAAEVRIEIEGVGEALRENILATLALAQQKDHPLLTPARIRQLHADAPRQIRRALEPFGYYRARIDAALTRDGDTWAAHYQVDPGPPVIVRSVDVRITGDGVTDAALRRWRDEFPLRPGDPLRHADYERAKREVRALAVSRGYLDVRLERHEIAVDLADLTAVIHLHVNTGARYYFGPLRFEQDAFTPRFVQRYVPFKPGAPYTTDRLLALQNALTDSDYFERIEVVPQPDRAEDQHIPVEVRLTPRKRHRFSAGVGFGTDTGARARFGWDVRRLNRHGHRLQTNLGVSEIKNTISSRYLIPLQRRDSELALSTSYIDENSDSTDSQTFRFGATRTQRRFGAQESLGVTFEREQFRVGNDRGTSHLLMPNARWLWVVADDRIHARRGLRAMVSVRGARESFGSDTSFLQGQLQVKGVYAPTPRQRILARGDGGFSVVSRFSELPASTRFFAGGDQSVRGYDYQELGPRDASGTVVGGRHLLVGSLEYEFNVHGNWSVAGFFDIGNAIDDFGDPLKKGVGFGLRWQSPVGPVRLDFANALDKPGKPWRIHFTVGPDL